MLKPNIQWKDALNRLIEGNQRFKKGLRSTEALLGHTKLKSLSENGQNPFAIILSCSDSRVPAELIFDCGFGELFVIRVAGNVVQPSQLASIEYAATQLGANLCVVMGHSKCGAVQATLASETESNTDFGPNINLLMELIRPSVKACLSQPENTNQTLLDRCINENVHQTRNEILKRSVVLSSLESANGFYVIEATFHMESGTVNFNMP